MPVRACPICFGAVREDDPLATREFPGRGMTAACRGCWAILHQQPEPKVVYPLGDTIPHVGEGMQLRKLRICGLCRQAMREGEEDKAMRVAEDDLDECRWQHYQQEIIPARQAWEKTLHDAEAHYRLSTTDAEQTHQSQLRQAAEVFEDLERQALEHADTEENYLQHLAEAQHARDQVEREAEAQYQAQTAPARWQRDHTLFRANIAYRKTSQSLWEQLPPEKSLPHEAGCYQACQECRAYYGPRIRERLARRGVKGLQQPMTDHDYL